MDANHLFAEFAEVDSGSGRIFVVGDIHGCYRECKILNDYLFEQEKLGDNDQLIFLGDYVDRGANSKEVIEELVLVKERYPQAKFLLGNHEALFLKFVLGMNINEYEHYIGCGGQSSLVSYGLNQEMTRQEKLRFVPESHLNFLQSLKVGIFVDSYLLVHAGVRPMRPLYQQRLDDVLWIREEFLNTKVRLGCTIVFGHTPFQEVYADLPYRIGIDTGLVFGGKLSAVELKSGKVLQIGRNERRVWVSKFKY